MEYAIPEEKRFPIGNLEDARKALAEIGQNGTKSDKYQVKQAVWAKYPSLRPFEGGV